MLHGIISKQRSVQNVCLEAKEKLRNREKQINGLAATATKVHRQKRKDGKVPAVTTAQRRNIPPAQPTHQPKRAAPVASTRKIGGFHLENKIQEKAHRVHRASEQLTGQNELQKPIIPVKKQELNSDQQSTRANLSQPNELKFEYNLQAERLARSISEYSSQDSVSQASSILSEESKIESSEVEDDMIIDVILEDQIETSDLDQREVITAEVEEKTPYSKLDKEQAEESLGDSTHLKEEKDEEEEVNVSLEKRSACSTPQQRREITEDSEDEDWDFCS